MPDYEATAYQVAVVSPETAQDSNIIRSSHTACKVDEQTN